MNEYVKADLNEIEKYIGKMDKVFDALYDSQSAINNSYNHTKTNWYDKVSIITGKTLCDTGNKIGKMGNYFSNMMRRLNSAYQKLDDDYGENHVWEAHFTPKQLECAINLEDEEMTRKINGTTVDGIMSFERALREYLDNTWKNVQSVATAYDDMSGYWDDNEYRRTGERVEEFRTSMTHNLEDLEEALRWIEERRRHFQEALEIMSQRDDI